MKSVIEVLVAVIILGLIVLLLLSTLKVTRDYQRLVVFRLGRTNGAKGPGLVLINPIIDRVSLVDLREQFLEIPHQTAITRDNAPISIDFIMFYRVFDPVNSVVNIRDFSGAALNIAATTLRSIVGDMALDDVLSQRESMNNALRVKLDEVTERWGVKVTNVEVREVNPPPAVQEAMTRQMSAERSRRAVITESEGKKQAAITVAEGEKQANVLAAEGAQQAAILTAEAERQSAILRAEGLSSALAIVGEIAQGSDPNTLLLQYLGALKELASSPSTKILLPMELTNLLSGIKDIAERVNTPGQESRSSISANHIGTVD